MLMTTELIKSFTRLEATTHIYSRYFIRTRYDYQLLSAPTCIIINRQQTDVRDGCENEICQTITDYNVGLGLKGGFVIVKSKWDSKTRSCVGVVNVEPEDIEDAHNFLKQYVGSSLPFIQLISHVKCLVQLFDRIIPLIFIDQYDLLSSLCISVKEINIMFYFIVTYNTTFSTSLCQSGAKVRKSINVHSNVYSLSALQEQCRVPLELREQILTYCSWPEFRSLCQSDTTFQCLVQRAFRQQVHRALLPFVPKENQPRFWSLMDATGSCIMGGIVRFAMFSNDERYHGASPTQIDIIISKSYKKPSATTLWDRFWTSLGYDPIFSNMSKGSFDASVEDIVHYRLPVSTLIYLLSHP